MKKFFIFLIMLIVLFPVVSTNAATKQYTVKVNTTYKIQKGEKLKLYVKGHKKSKNIKWKTSNKKIASVSKKSVVTGKKGGTVTISAKIGKKKYKTKVMVIAGENTKYEYDSDPADEEDRYDLSDY